MGKQLRVCLAVSAVWPTYRPKKTTGLYFRLILLFLIHKRFPFFSLLGHSKPSHLKTGINCLPGYDIFLQFFLTSMRRGVLGINCLPPLFFIYKYHFLSYCLFFISWFSVSSETSKEKVKHNNFVKS